MVSLRDTPWARRVRNRPVALAAVALVAADAILALAGARVPVLDAAVLVLAPGLAFLPLLPLRVRAHWLAALAAAPALGVAVSMVTLVSASRLGVPVDGTWVRVVIAAVVLIGGFGLVGRDLEGEPPGLWEVLGLIAALVLGVVLGGRVIAGFPVPGNDWAKYVLYADEIRRQGSLLIDNPYWMLGVPFREDPGVPALYGGFLSMAGGPAIVVVHGIWVFSAIATAAVFSYVRSFWGAAAGVLAAVLFAVIPVEQDILGWHGAPTVAALALLALALSYVTTLLVDGLTWAAAAGLALVVVALAAAHRLTFIIAALAFAAVVVVALIAFRADRRRLVIGVGKALAGVVVLGGAVVSDLLAREDTFGGTQGYRAYADTKLHLANLASDLTWAVAVLGVLAVAYLAFSKRLHTRALLPVACLFVVVVALTFSWLAHLPLSYLRMAYYVPLPLAVAIAVALTGQPRRRQPVAAAAAVVLVGVTTVIAWHQAHVVRGYYRFTDAGSLRGLDLVARDLRPNEVIVADRCWSFQAAWLLHTRTLAALETADIQPKAELAPARVAASILAGTPEGRAAARRLGVRYLIVDPTCMTVGGERQAPPFVGRPIYAGARLAIFALAPRRPAN